MSLLAVSLPSTPFTDPVLIVATATLIFLAVPLLAERLRVPGIIGLIVVGAAVGPHGFNLLARSNTIVLLGTVGLLYLMLMVGLELDLHQFDRHRNRSLVFGTLSFLLPGALGTALGLALGYRLPSSLLVGAVFASHTLLAYPIASRLGIVRNPAVTAALGGTILTEILALLLLAVVVRSRGAPMDAGFWAALAVPFAVYVVAVMWGLPRLGRWFFRTVSSDGSTEFVFVLAALFATSYLAHFGGVEPIVGALLAGLALNRLIPHHGALMSRIVFAGNAIFIPFFLLSVGMVVDVRALDTARAWGVAALLALLVIAAKWAAARGTQRLFGYTADEGWVVFGLSVPHAAGTLAIVLVGFDAGLLDQAEVNGVVVMILATCLAGPWVVQRFGRRVAMAEAERPYDPVGAPRRVLVPLANPATSAELLELALIVRGRDSAEPLRVVSVVPGDGDSGHAEVAEAEAVLGHAVLHAAAADVPVIPMTRVDTSIASGIARAIVETRTSTVVIGWDGRPGGTRAVFGRVLDHLLDTTPAQVVVAHLPRAVRTARRVAVVVPRELELHPGFRDLLRTVNTVASGVSASVRLIGVGGEPARLLRLHGEIRPHAPASADTAAGWQAVEELAAALPADDLLVLLATRPGMSGWSPRLERLPTRLAAARAGNLLVAYAPEADAPGSGGSELGPGVAPERVVRLRSTDFAGAVAEMLEGMFDPAERREIVRAVVHAEEQLSSEVRPGVALPHLRREELHRPLLLLGTSADGVVLPRGSAPAHLLFLLVSPADDADGHLRSLAALARLLSEPGRVEEIMRQHAAH